MAQAVGQRTFTRQEPNVVVWRTKRCPRGGAMIATNGSSLRTIPMPSVVGGMDLMTARSIASTPMVTFDEFSGTGAAQTQLATPMLNMLPEGWISKGDPSTALAADPPTGTSDPDAGGVAVPGAREANRVLIATLITDQRLKRVAVWRSETGADGCPQGWTVRVIADPAPNDGDGYYEVVYEADNTFLYVDPVRANVVYTLTASVPLAGIRDGNKPGVFGGLPRRVIYLAKSTDGGATFSPFRRVTGPATLTGSFAEGATLAPFSQAFHPLLSSRGSTAAGNPLVMAWYAVDSARPCSTCRELRVSISTDEGTNWTSPAVAARVTTSGRFWENGPTRLDHRPAMLVGNTTGQIVVAVADRHPTLGQDRIIVRTASMVRLADGRWGPQDENRWRTAFEIPFETRPAMQFMPLLAKNRYDETDDDVLLSWYDTRRSADGRSVGVYALHLISDGSFIANSLSNGGSGISPIDVRRNIHEISSGTFAIPTIDRAFAEYFGADVYPDNTSGAGSGYSYLVAWTDSRRPNGTTGEMIRAATVRLGGVP